jgi:hypothetical protein
MRASVSTTRSPEDVDLTVPVHAVATSAFDLPDHLARKANPALIAGTRSRTCPTGSMPSARRPAAPAMKRWTATCRSTG